MAESTPLESKAERVIAPMSKLGQAKEEISAAKPLGRRYSFITRGIDGQHREVDKETALKSALAASLTVEANQHSYIQIWETRESSTRLRLFPDQGSGKIFSRAIPGQRRVIPLPTGTGMITIRVSPSPLSPITGEESVTLDRSVLRQIQETITTKFETGLEGQAHYVVNPDTNQSAQLVVEIPLNR